MPDFVPFSSKCYCCRMSKGHIGKVHDQPHKAVKMTEPQSHFLNILHPVIQEATQ